MRTTEDMNFEGKKIATFCTGIILCKTFETGDKVICILKVFVPSVSNCLHFDWGGTQRIDKITKFCPQTTHALSWLFSVLFIKANEYCGPNHCSKDRFCFLELFSNERKRKDIYNKKCLPWSPIISSGKCNTLQLERENSGRFLPRCWLAVICHWISIRLTWKKKHGSSKQQMGSTQLLLLLAWELQRFTRLSGEMKCKILKCFLH